MTSLHLFLNIFVSRRPGVANFADIINILTMFIKKIFEDSKKKIYIEIMYQNAIYGCLF